MYQVLDHEPLVQPEAVLFSVLSAIGAVLIGVLAYHEKTTPYQIVGLVLGIAAIAFLSIE
ncbi:MAG: hypothetical protein NVS4B11_14900 [Ktedonobacteraceae bacterium]